MSEGASGSWNPATVSPRSIFTSFCAALSSAVNPSACCISSTTGWKGVPAVYGVARHSSQVCGTVVSRSRSS